MSFSMHAMQCTLALSYRPTTTVSYLFEELPAGATVCNFLKLSCFFIFFLFLIFKVVE